MISSNEICKYLEWDSRFFGFSIGRIILNSVNEEAIAKAISWSESNAIKCLYFFCDIEEREPILLVENNDFHLVDIRVAFEKQNANPFPLTGIPFGYNIRQATLADIPYLREIARSSHRITRFYNDYNFPRSSCDLLYETWIEKSVSGYADVVFVVDEHSVPIGYVTCHSDEYTKGHIGLIAIKEDSHGKGLGELLIGKAFEWFSQRNIKIVTVVTQGQNISGQRFYQKCGFWVKGVQIVYHKWFNLENS